jgi:hypothetical protein
MIQRRTPLRRSQKRIQTRRRVPRRGPATIPQEEFRNAAYKLWIKMAGHCIVCHAPGCDPAHTENNGMRSKGRDSSCVPLCRVHHQEYDSGRVAFEAKYELDMKREAAIWWGKFLES